MMKTKKILALALAMTMGATLLAGCGGSSSGTSTGSAASAAASTTAAAASAAASTAAAASEAAPAASGEEVVLEFPCIWVGTDSKAEVFGKMVEDFNTQYDGQYQVNISEYTDYDAYQDYLRTTISAGAAPDLFSVKTLADVKLYASSGKILDITDFLAGDISSKYSAGVLDSYKVDGKNYALPWEAAIIPILYNGTQLETAGVSNLPTTWDEFFSTLDALKASGVDTPASFMTSSNAWTAMLWYSYALGSNGGADVLAGDWDTAVFEQAADIVKKIYGYAPSDAIGAAAADVNSHFFNYETSVYTNGSWILSNIQQNAADGIYDNLKFGLGPNKSIIQYTQAFILSGASGDAAKEAAVQAFLDWVTDADRLTELSNASGAVFVPKTNAVDNAYINEIVALRDSAEIIIPSFESSVSTVAANDFSPQLEALLVDDISSAEFVETLQADNAE